MITPEDARGIRGEPGDALNVGHQISRSVKSFDTASVLFFLLTIHTGLTNRNQTSNGHAKRTTAPIQP